MNKTILILLGLCFTSACDSQEQVKQTPSVETRPEVIEKDPPIQWAEEVLGKPGLNNFHKVSDTLYRGAQPEPRGFAELKKMGIKTVINLRTLHSDRELCEAADLDYVHIRTQAWEGEDDEVVDFLKVALDPEKQPVFVHCQHGADRTGTMCALYRIVEQGWTREEAIKEMTTGGFGFHRIWVNLPRYIKKVDLASIQQEVGQD
ncbi:MAG: dual specificity protein phosphatase family protein [Verrucomicrobiota bacterium]